MDENNQTYSNDKQPDCRTPYQAYQVSLSGPVLKSLTGWATFRAVIDIISGALACLGIITAAYGIPLIIAGIKLLNAVDELKRYMAVNDAAKIQETFNSFNRYFKLSGISTIVKIVMTILFLVLYIIFIVYIVQNMGDVFPEFPGMEYGY